MTRTGGLRALLGIGRRSELAVGLAVGVMLAAVAGMATAAPRALERAEISSLDRAIDEAPPATRRLAVRAIEDFPAGFNRNPLELPERVVDRAADVLPESVASSFGAPRVIVDSNRFRVSAARGVEPSSPTFITFRVHPELAEHGAIVAGRAAGATVEELDGRRVIEFELSTVAATVLGWDVGDTLDLDADTTDAITRQYVGGLPDPFVGRLVGLRDLDDASDPYWFGDARLHRPTVADTGVGANFFVFGAIAVEALPVRPYMIEQRSPMFVEQRRDLMAGTVTIDNVDDLLAGLVALEASSVATPSVGRPGISVGLQRVLAAEADQRTVARSTLVLAAVGVLAVALVTLAQMLNVGFSRRRRWLSVALARGASPRQVVVTTIAEVGIIAAGAVFAGSLLARLAMGGSGSAIEQRLLGALWLGSIAAAGVLAVAEVQRPAGTGGRAGRGHGLGKWARVAGALLVVIAAGSLITFRRRGLDVEVGSIDALALLVPVLVPLAVVFLTRWVLPLALGALSQFGMALGPGRLVGIRRAIADPGAGAGLIAVLALSLTVAGLALGINRSLEDGIADAAWREVGAPYRIESRDPAVVERIVATPGIQLGEYGDNQFRLQRGGDVFNARLINVETTAIAALTAGTAADLRVPSALLSVDGEGRVPAIAATRIGGQRVRRGDVVRGTGSFAAVEFVVVQVRAEAFERDTDWIMVDRSTFESAGERPAPTSTVLFDASPESFAVIESVAAEEGLEIVDRAAIERRQGRDPLVLVVRRGYLAAGAATTALALLGVAGLAVVTARQRRREIAVLGLLGAGRREIARAVRSELIAPLVAGVVLGSGLGWLMATMFDGRFDMSPFADGSAVPLRPDPAGQVMVGAAVAGGALLVAVVLVQRIVHVRVDDVLRVEGSG